MTVAYISGRGRTSDIEQIKSQLVSRLDELVVELFGGAAVRRGRHEYRVGSIDGGYGDNLKIRRSGVNAGLWTDFSNGSSGDVIALIQFSRKLHYRRTLEWACEWLGRAPHSIDAGEALTTVVAPLPVGTKEKLGWPRVANRDYMARRKRALSENVTALDWLERKGVRRPTMLAFHLGLALPYTSRSGIEYGNAIIAPVINRDGAQLSTTIYLNVPGLTLHPSAPDYWARGAAYTYYDGAVRGRGKVFVCERVTDLWGSWQELNALDAGNQLLFIAPTHKRVIPDEWRYGEFWERFGEIYLGFDDDASGDEFARAVARAVSRETLRVRPPNGQGKNWIEFWRNGGTPAEFIRLIKGAKVVGDAVSNGDGDTGIGRHDYRPVDIGTDFHRGYLYYPVRTLNNIAESVREGAGDPVVRVLTKVETMVVRSDRTVHSVQEEPAPKGTPPADRVLRLTDGTLIGSRPKASIYSTWSWQSIKAYRDGTSRTRDLAQILGDVSRHLRQAVWLPYEADYSLLTLLVPVTYAQAVFHSVPIILVVGPTGSGKSALGRAMGQLCANAASVGQASAAGVARLMNETKGFVVMDDLESIGKRSGKDSAQFNELIQALKLSYNKETSWKIWTDVSRGMRVERMNFFGVKMINNTSGADSILGSRMLRIRTRRVPEEFRAVLGTFEQNDPAALNRLRDELHTWTFENANLIDDTYRRRFPSPSDRAAEITAPLRVFAEIAGDKVLEGGLDRALAGAVQHEVADLDVVDVMKAVVRELVREGYKEVSITHVMMEVKAVIAQGSGRHDEDPHWEDPAWVGRQLRKHGLVDQGGEPSRKWLYGVSLRTYPVNKELLAEVLGDPDEKGTRSVTRKPTDFCVGCADCRYRMVDCPMMLPRLAAEKDLRPGH